MIDEIPELKVQDQEDKLSHEDVELQMLRKVPMNKC